MVTPKLIGCQTPRIEWCPPDAKGSRGAEAVTWAKDILGLSLDPWQELVLDRMLATRDGSDKWAALEFGLVVPRQCGKSVVLAVRELFALLVLGESKVMHTAHRSRTAKNAYRETRKMIRSAPGWVENNRTSGDLGDVRITFRDTNGEQAVGLADDSSVEFTTRSAVGGRGLSGTTVVFDEAQILDEGPIDALIPTMSAQSITENPQVIYTGSAGTFVSTALARIRRRGMSGQRAKRLCYLEWSIDEDGFMAMDPDDRLNPEMTRHLWPQANPALGLRISEEFIEQVELGQMDPFSFARERLGVGSWPVDDSLDWPIPKKRWRAVAAPDSALPTGSLVFAVSGTWGERAGSLAACGGVDGVAHGWLERREIGVAWIVPALVKLASGSPTSAVVIDTGGPVGHLAPKIKAALPSGVQLVEVSSREVGHACGALLDAVTSDPAEFSHRGQPEVDAALAGTAKKDIGDGLWAWDRSKSPVDIAPLEALTLARWGFVKFGRKTYDPLDSVL